MVGVGWRKGSVASTTLQKFGFGKNIITAKTLLENYYTQLNGRRGEKMRIVWKHFFN